MWYQRDRILFCGYGGVQLLKSFCHSFRNRRQNRDMERVILSNKEITNPKPKSKITFENELVRIMQYTTRWGACAHRHYIFKYDIYFHFRFNFHILFRLDVAIICFVTIWLSQISSKYSSEENILRKRIKTEYLICIINLFGPFDLSNTMFITNY